MSDLESRVAALEAEVAALKAGAVPPPAAGSQYEPSDEDQSRVYQILRGMGFQTHAQDVSSGNVMNMLRATNGDAQQAAENFAADARRYVSAALEQKPGLTHDEALDWAGYLLWVKKHDEGTNALAIAQGFSGGL